MTEEKETTMDQVLSRIIQSMKFLQGGIPGISLAGTVGFVETDEGNLEKLANTGVTPFQTWEVSEKLRRHRDEADEKWLVITLSEEDIEHMNLNFLRELQTDIRRGQSIVFVAPFGGWKAWVALLHSQKEFSYYFGLLDCSRRFQLSDT